MGDAGILGEDDRVELIEGELVDMAPIGNRHSSTVRRLINLLVKVIGHSAILDVQNPVVLGTHSEPQPDIVLLRPRENFYADSTPGPADVLEDVIRHFETEGRKLPTPRTRPMQEVV
jgi:Uma2 family endonuclease